MIRRPTRYYRGRAAAPRHLRTAAGPRVLLDHAAWRGVDVGGVGDVSTSAVRVPFLLDLLRALQGCRRQANNSLTVFHCPTLTPYRRPGGVNGSFTGVLTRPWHSVSALVHHFACEFRQRRCGLCKFAGVAQKHRPFQKLPATVATNPQVNPRIGVCGSGLEWCSEATARARQYVSVVTARSTNPSQYLGRTSQN